MQQHTLIHCTKQWEIANEKIGVNKNANSTQKPKQKQQQ